MSMISSKDLVWARTRAGNAKNKRVILKIPIISLIYFIIVLRISFASYGNRQDLSNSMNLHLSPIFQIKLLVSLAILVCTSFATAAIDELNLEEPQNIEQGAEQNTDGLVEVYSRDALVELHIRQDNLADYKTRRETHGVYVGVDYEQYVPSNFVSLNDGKNYSELFNNEPIPLVSLAIDYKYNFALGSLAVGLSGGMGSIEDDRSGDKRTLEITKIMGTLKYTMDNLMNEPYVAPYVGFSMYQMSINDKSTTNSVSESPPMGYSYALGLLIQLDWLDHDAAKTATFNYGLENTFLDVFMAQYMSSGGEEDANMETDPVLGVGLRMEF